ncbi:hypothetical protein [Salinibaculum marinum]|uniref:hypothetical protein n=1 Tax=Salinibaculum marinum TaxID=3131993 RepID=UPI0030D56F5A
MTGFVVSRADILSWTVGERSCSSASSNTVRNRVRRVAVDDEDRSRNEYTTPYSEFETSDEGEH